MKNLYWTLRDLYGLVIISAFFAFVLLGCAIGEISVRIWPPR